MASPAAPTVLSRVTAVLALVVLMAGGAYLAHALTGDWRPALVASPAADADRAPVSPSGLSDEEREAAGAIVDAMKAYADEPGDRDETRKRLARALAEQMTGGAGLTDPLPPPPGAVRVLGMAGGMTFYRLADGAPADRVAEAADHYRQAFAAGGWQLLTDHDRALTNRSACVLIATRDRTVAAIYIHERAGAARAVVRDFEE